MSSESQANSRQNVLWACVCIVLGLCLIFTGMAMGQEPSDALPAPGEKRPEFDGPDRRGGPDGPRRPGRGDFGPGGREIEFTDEQAEFVLKFLAEHNPVMAERLADLRESDPQEYQRALNRVVGSERLRPILFMLRFDPEGARLRLDLMQAQARAGKLRRQLRREEEQGGDQIRTELREAVTAIVDAEFKLREHELAQLESRLAQLREELTRRSENRQQLIERLEKGMIKGPDDFDRPRRPRRDDVEPPDSP